MNLDDLVKKMYQKIHDLSYDENVVLNCEDIDREYVLGMIQGLEEAITIVKNSSHRATPLDRE